MILRENLAATHLVMFATGAPDGDVTWRLLAADGSEISNGTVTPAAEAVSVHLPLAAADVALPSGVFQSTVDLLWSYMVGGAAINGEQRYTIEARLPLGISPDGVRSKLGVSPSELPDSEIPLVYSYLSFVDTVSQSAYDAALDGGLVDLRIRNAVEAMAALSLVSTMQLRIAQSESSDSNQFKRQTIDWAVLRSELSAIVDKGLVAVDPLYDPAETSAVLFVVASPATDAFTGG